MILVTGGTGYIGRRVAARLAEQGEKVRVVARGLRQAPLPDTVEVVPGNVRTGDGLAEAMGGVEKVAHLVGIIREVGEQTFDGVIRGGTENVVNAARQAGIKKFLHMSALGARDDPAFPYLKAKWDAERIVIRSGLNYTILRPSVVFGEGDEFINALAGLVRRNPVVPIAGDGRTLFQPIWLEDVVTCIVTCLLEGQHDGKIVEIGGPEHLSYEQMVDIVTAALERRRRKAHIPLFLMRPLVRVMERVLSRPPVTGEQLKMLRLNNITAIDSVERQFGFAPKRLAEGIDYIKG